MAAHPLSANDAQRFERLILPWLPVLLRMARYITHNEQDGGDAVQETLLKAMQALGNLNADADVRSWLLTILRRTCIDRFRSVTRRQEISLETASMDDPADEGSRNAGVYDDQWENPEELMARFEDEAVSEAMRALPQDIRWTLLLVDVEQLDQTEAAGILEVPLGTIKSRAHRGRQMLRDRLYSLALSRGWISQPSEELKP